MEFINKTIGDYLDYLATEYPDVEAVVYADRGLRLTYSEFNEVVKQAAKGFMKLGVKKGDHVAIWATNRPEWMLTMFATAKIGAVLVTVNTNYKLFEFEYLMKQSDTSTLVLMDSFKDSNYIEILQKLCPEMFETGVVKSEKFPFLKNVIGIDKSSHNGILPWDELMELGKSVPDEELFAVQRTLDAHDVINMQYTSGTTGFPKGVMLTHYNIINNGKGIGDRMKFTEKDRLLICVPFFHCFGLVLAIMASITHATTMVPVVAFSPLEVMQTIEKERCTAVHGVPTMFIFMLEHPQFDQFDFSTLRTGIMAGSLCPTNVMRAVIDKMNMREITIVFGQTESSPGCTQTLCDDDLETKVNTVGREFEGVECKIVDPETGEECPPNTQGEFVARGYNIMKGYYKMPQATAEAIDADGWLHTGDLAFKDDKGCYHITGRIKDMIIRGGENIYPREIEELIYTNPKVKDVQVVGVPSAQLGEEVAAFVILKGNENSSQEEMQQFVRENAARHKVPKYVAFIEEFPMTASGKIQKYKLRELAVDIFGLDE